MAGFVYNITWNKCQKEDRPTKWHLFKIKSYIDSAKWPFSSEKFFVSIIHSKKFYPFCEIADEIFKWNCVYIVEVYVIVNLSFEKRIPLPHTSLHWMPQV